MAEFRESVQSMCWVIPVLGSMYFWVMTLSSFLSTRPSDSSSSPSPAPENCNQEKIKNTVETWVRWMALLLVSSVYIMYHVRKTVEALAAAETKGTSLEDEIHKAVQKELEEATKAVEVALNALVKTTSVSGKDYVEAQHQYVTAVGLRNVATAKVARTKPKEGLERLLIGRRRQVRLLYFLASFFFFAGGVCAAVSFYLSLRLQVRCKDSAATVIPFVVVGAMSLSVFLKASWVAFRKN